MRYHVIFVFYSGAATVHLKTVLPFTALAVGELWVTHPQLGASRFGQHLSNIAAATEDLIEAMPFTTASCSKKINPKEKNINIQQTMFSHPPCN